MDSTRVDEHERVGGDDVSAVTDVDRLWRVFRDGFREEGENGGNAECFVDDGANHALREQRVEAFVTPILMGVG